MLLSKREQAQIERRLVACLTEACEMAKARIPGFTWLTHEVDFAHFPSSLRVTWVFDTRVNRDQAMAGESAREMLELTSEALREADVELKQVAAHLAFDSEEHCRQVSAGNWQRHLARSPRPERH
ncbi:hypothetical protein [Pseudomonas sp. MWU13-2100]|uniref:hypothetical protein n=1 Tax=Pseudomonas sp. MWU13-2100 TaxID=2935075 RepID=UPI00200CCC64|nr:hypothetical protein [Pseudomonas sp. MWU13-2100]